MAVLLGTGTGSFSAATSYTLGANCAPTCVASADFNGDLIADLAVTNTTASSGLSNISILLGTGTGSFGAVTNFTLGSGYYPHSVCCADFNQDGKMDLATANRSSNTISVLLGTGTGSFGTRTNFALAGGTTPRSIVTTDLNGDGKTDLVTANYGNNSVSVLLGNGLGTFTATLHNVNAAAPESAITGDFNGDGKTDVVTANSGTDNVSILLGNGTGGFSGNAVTFQVGTDPFQVITEDFNMDGKPDLSTANYISANASILLSCLVTDVLDADGDSSIAVYPNPFDNELMINVGKVSSGNYTFLLTDVLGKVIIKKSGNGPVQQLKLPGLPAGVYYFTIIDENNNRFTKKMIKN